MFNLFLLFLINVSGGNKNLINEDLFITGEEVYGKEIIDQLRELIYNIG